MFYIIKKSNHPCYEQPFTEEILKAGEATARSALFLLARCVSDHLPGNVVTFKRHKIFLRYNPPDTRYGQILFAYLTSRQARQLVNTQLQWLYFRDNFLN